MQYLCVGKSRSTLQGLISHVVALFILGLACTAPSQAQITTLANFTSTGGGLPIGGLTLSGGTLYGTTVGSVFSLPAAGGTLTTLGSFSQSQSVTDVIVNGGTIYGTIFQGGANFDGSIFSLPIGGGTPTNIATFSGPSSVIQNGLTLSADRSTFYGSTQTNAGADGTVFSVPIGGGTPTTLGTLTGTPQGDLTQVGGTLYGVTSTGGTNNLGTVFSIPVGGGTITTLVNFTGTNNGSAPESGLT